MTPEEYQDLLVKHGVAFELDQDFGALGFLDELEGSDDEMVVRVVSYGRLCSGRRMALVLPPDREILESVRSAAMALSSTYPLAGPNLVRDLDRAISGAAPSAGVRTCQDLPAPTRGRKRGAMVYSDDGPSCGADRSEAGWKKRQKIAQKEAWRQGEIPNAWPRQYEAQVEHFQHGRTSPVKFSMTEAVRLETAWKSTPPKERKRSENPRVTEIPVSRFGDPDLRWFVSGPQAGKILVMFSGGKDSLALLLYVMEACASVGLDPKECVEAWHQSVDGRPPHLGGESSVSKGAGSDYEKAKWDWPVTEDYCRAVCECLGIRLYFGWREGGLQGTVLRGEHRLAQRAPAKFELPGGGPPGTAGGERGGENVRMSYPLPGANLKTRWCSSEVKIDVAEAQVAGRKDLRGKRVLYCSGERAEESANRATYAEREFYGDFSASTGKIKGLHAAHGRHVERWRPLLKWCELDVWAIVARWGVRPHPAYVLGFGRLSCMTCIFGNQNQWATVKKLDPKRFAQFAATETELAARKARDVRKGVPKAEKRLPTIKEDTPLPEFVKGFSAYDASDNERAAEQAMSVEYTGQVRVAPDKWKLPAGAFGEDTGPV